MPAARYWRAIAVEAQAGGDLELSALHVYDAGGRVDAGAALTSTFPPGIGTLSNLQDSDFSTTALFSKADISAPSFALRWDFGAPIEVYGVRAGGPVAAKFLKSMALQYSSDGSAWSDGAAEFGDFIYPGQSSLTAQPVLPPWFATQRGLWKVGAISGGSNFAAVGNSADGMKILAGTQGGALFSSSDAGESWAVVTGASTASWLSIAMSSDGSKILTGTSSNIRRSSDGGATWATFNPVGTESWQSVHVSKDGQRMYAAGYSLYWSSDGGSTWTKYANTGTTDPWRDISVSDDGQIIVASTSVNGRLLYSVDAGATWASRSPASSTTAWSIGMSGNGQTILIGPVSSGPPQISKNGGTSWTPLPALGSRIWTACRVSENGKSLFAVSTGTFAYLSLDGGATWRAVPNLSGQLYSGALSRDGLKAAVGSAGSGVIPLFVARDPMFADPPFRTMGTGPAEFFASSPVPDSTTVKLPDAMLWRDMEFSGAGKIVGTVKEKNTPENTPLRRRVRLVRELDGLQIRETWSDAATGAYAFLQIDERYKYSVISYDYLANYRAVIADSLTPEIMT